MRFDLNNDWDKETLLSLTKILEFNVHRKIKCFKKNSGKFHLKFSLTGHL